MFFYKSKCLKRFCKSIFNMSSLKYTIFNSIERTNFMKQVREMQILHDQKLQQFAKDSDIRNRMDTFELDERRSAHIDQLIKTNEQTVEKIQSYFHGVTMNQLALIGTLKEQNEAIRQKLEQSEKTAAAVSSILLISFSVIWLVC